MTQKARSICSGLKLFVSSIRFVKQHDYRTNPVKHGGKSSKAPPEKSGNGFRLGDDLGGGLGGDVAKEVNAGKKNRLPQAHHNRVDDTVERCGETVGTEALAFFDVVQSLGKECHHGVGGKAAGGADQKTDKNQFHIIPGKEYQQAACRSNGKAHKGHRAFAVFPNQRPQQCNAVPQGCLTDHIYKDLFECTVVHGV